MKIMNKQEAIEEINNLKGLNILDKTINFDDEMISKKDVLNIVKQLDEPVKPPEPKPLEIEKPVVPQYVADWYEDNKDVFENSIYDLCVNLFKDASKDNLYKWFSNNNNKPIVTLIKMKLYGYEVEKDKLYTVEIPIANSPLGYHYVLRKTTSGEIIIDSFYNKNWGNYDYCQLTEAEIKKDFEWAWKYAEEVK